MHYAKRVTVGLVMGLLGTVSQAQLQRADDVIRYRKAVMVMMKWHYDHLAQQTKAGTSFSRTESQRHADWLDALSKSVPEGYTVEAQEGDTRALPAIWGQWPKFQALAERFQADAAKLREVARKGDPTTLKVQLNELTRTCKSCHDDFKKS